MTHGELEERLTTRPGYVEYFLDQLGKPAWNSASRTSKVTTSCPHWTTGRTPGKPCRASTAGHRCRTWGVRPIAANAYLGGCGIAALREGADIVVCGRVTDASLTVGPAARWHDWCHTD